MLEKTSFCTYEREGGEVDLFPEIHEIQFRYCPEFQDQLSYLFIRSFVFVLSQPFRYLAHIFHGDFIAVIIAVNSFGNIAKFPVFETYQTMRNGFNLGYFGHMHSHVFEFRQAIELVCLRFENVPSP